MNQSETQWDKLLKIKTSGRDDSNSDQYRYPYEPTPYCVLERLAGGRTDFVMGNAERYAVPTDVDRCYFFNPFSVEILKSVLAKITDSYYENPRELQLFFYYPSDEYVAYLMTRDNMMFVDEIDCGDLFPDNDPREKILIFEVF